MKDALYNSPLIIVVTVLLLSWFQEESFEKENNETWDRHTVMAAHSNGLRFKSSWKHQTERGQRWCFIDLLFNFLWPLIAGSFFFSCTVQHLSTQRYTQRCSTLRAETKRIAEQNERLMMRIVYTTSSYRIYYYICLPNFLFSFELENRTLKE